MTNIIPNEMTSLSISLIDIHVLTSAKTKLEFIKTEPDVEQIENKQ